MCRMAPTRAIVMGMLYHALVCGLNFRYVGGEHTIVCNTIDFEKGIVLSHWSGVFYYRLGVQ